MVPEEEEGFGRYEGWWWWWWSPTSREREREREGEMWPRGRSLSDVAAAVVVVAGVPLSHVSHTRTRCYLRHVISGICWGVLPHSA